MKVLITSALPYVNNVPHLGNIIGCVLSGDVFARYCRSKGYDTLYIAGTDEHGTTTEVKALEEGLTPQEVCDKYYAIHKEIYEWFGCSFDAFGRTSSDVHRQITQQIFKKLLANGYIIKDFLEELYCEKCKKSLADRFVEGTCPHCTFAGARGDQCDNCGHLLNATELKNPKCKVCSSVPIVKKVEHLFLDLAKLQPQLEQWIEKAKAEGFWTDNTVMYTNSWLREGLKKRCISRQLKWGIPIPLEGFEHMVFYVWFDAPIGYISITAADFPQYKDWWMNPEDVRLFQFMGKDNVPFHTILFPGTLMGTKDKYTLAHHINTTEYLNYEDGKFSKSRKTGVFGDDAIRLGIPSDSFRYYLLINRPERSDTVFSWDDFQEKHNSELIANLANLVNRTIVFLNKYFDSKVPKAKLGPDDEAFLEKTRQGFGKVTDLLEKVKIKDALKEVMAISALGNKYFQDSEPWALVKSDVEQASTKLYVLANFVKDLAILIEPFMPATSEKIMGQLGLAKTDWQDLGKMSLETGHQVSKAEALFQKLEDERKLEIKQEFSGAKSTKLDLRVAKILEAKDHPEAEKLVILTLDLGGSKRQIVAGIRAFYDKAELVGKSIVIVSNLKAAKLRGIESQGMLLAAQSKDGKLGLVTCDAKPGTSAAPSGYEIDSSEISIDDFAKFKLEAKKSKVFLDGKELLSEAGPVWTERGIEGKVR